MISWYRALSKILLSGKIVMKAIRHPESIKYYNKTTQNSLVADIQIHYGLWMILLFWYYVQENQGLEN